MSMCFGCDESESEPAAPGAGQLGVDVVGGGDLDHPPQGRVGHAQPVQQTLVDVDQVLE